MEKQTSDVIVIIQGNIWRFRLLAVELDVWMNEWMNENARILSAFENRLRAGFV